MKKQSIKILMILAIALSSCAHYYYIPNVQNVPLFKEKNEFRAIVTEGGTDEISTTEIQAAYSITNNLAVMTNFMSANGGERTDNSWAKGKYLEGAFGYYRPFDKFGVFEVYGGFGSGNQHHQYGTKDIDNGTADLSFVKCFLQPSLGFTFHAVDIAFSTRLTRLSFYNIDNKIKSNTESHYVDTIAQNKVSYLFEPAITLRGGWKYVKVQLQLSKSKNITHPNLRFEKTNLSLGLYFTIAKRYRKNKSVQ
jgi:hypothetical protein